MSRIGLVALALGAICAQDHAAAQSTIARGSKPAVKAASTWLAPKAADGHPDLQGVWDYRTATPLERPAEFAGKEFLTDAEIADYERRAAARPDGRPPDDPRADPSVHPVEWLDYRKRGGGRGRSSLIVDPPDGRIPAKNLQGRERDAALRDAVRGRGP